MRSHGWLDAVTCGEGRGAEFKHGAHSWSRCCLPFFEGAGKGGEIAAWYIGSSGLDQLLFLLDSRLRRNDVRLAMVLGMDY